MDKDGQFLDNEYRELFYWSNIPAKTLKNDKIPELNMERRRKRKATKKTNGVDDVMEIAISDPLIELLIDKENR